MNNRYFLPQPQLVIKPVYERLWRQVLLAGMRVRPEANPFRHLARNPSHHGDVLVAASVEVSRAFALYPKWFCLKGGQGLGPSGNRKAHGNSLPQEVHPRNTSLSDSRQNLLSVPRAQFMNNLRRHLTRALKVQRR